MIWVRGAYKIQQDFWNPNTKPDKSDSKKFRTRKVLRPDFYELTDDPVHFFQNSLFKNVWSHSEA